MIRRLRHRKHMRLSEHAGTIGRAIAVTTHVTATSVLNGQQFENLHGLPESENS
jgi:hypothetical protein